MAEREQALYAAYASTYHWRQVGTVANHGRGEHLIASAAVAVGLLDVAARHARRYAELIEAHPTAFEDWDRAFAAEALARVASRAGDPDAARLRVAADEAAQPANLQDQERRGPTAMGRGDARGASSASGAQAIPCSTTTTWAVLRSPSGPAGGAALAAPLFGTGVAGTHPRRAANGRSRSPRAGCRADGRLHDRDDPVRLRHQRATRPADPGRFRYDDKRTACTDRRRRARGRRQRPGGYLHRGRTD